MFSRIFRIATWILIWSQHVIAVSTIELDVVSPREGTSYALEASGGRLPVVFAWQSASQAWLFNSTFFCFITPRESADLTPQYPSDTFDNAVSSFALNITNDQDVLGSDNETYVVSKIAENVAAGEYRLSWGYQVPQPTSELQTDSWWCWDSPRTIYGFVDFAVVDGDEGSDVEAELEECPALAALFPIVEVEDEQDCLDLVRKWNRKPTIEYASISPKPTAEPSPCAAMLDEEEQSSIVSEAASTSTDADPAETTGTETTGTEASATETSATEPDEGSGAAGGRTLVSFTGDVGFIASLAGLAGLGMLFL